MCLGQNNLGTVVSCGDDHTRHTGSAGGLVGAITLENGVGPDRQRAYRVVLLFLTNVLPEDGIPINLIAILVCAVGGVFGWLITVVVHLLGIAF